MSFPKDISSYCSWMEQMAKNHIDLRHGESVNGKSQKKNYAEVWLSSDPFEKMDFGPLLREIKSEIKYPLLLNLGCSFEFDKQENTKTKVEGMFAILDKTEQTNQYNSEGRKKAYRTSQNIANDILTRIDLYMKKNVHWGHLSNDMTAEAVGPINIDGKLYGVVCQLEYKVNAQPCYDESKWLKEVTVEL